MTYPAATTAVRRFVLCEWSPAIGLPLEPVGVLVVEPAHTSPIRPPAGGQGGQGGQGCRWAVGWLPLSYERADGWRDRIAAAGSTGADLADLVDDWTADPTRAAHELPPGPGGMRVEDLVELTLDEALAAFAPLWR